MRWSRICSITVLCGLLALWSSGQARGEVFTIDSSEEWQRWEGPTGLVEITRTEALELVKYRKDINAVLDASRFTHPTQKRGEAAGGIWRADSGPQTATLIIDGNRETFWKPDPEDQVQRWQVEIDLGRPVLAKEIRLRFPDQEDARPFRQFRVLVATGARIQAQDDVFKFDSVYITSMPNEDTEVIIDLDGNRDTTRVVDLDPWADLSPERRHRLIQFVRFAANEKSEHAALAEVEVLAVGDNVSLGVLERGGQFVNGLLARDPQNQFDGLLDTFGNIFTVRQQGDWKEEGLWWQVDLGALFWIDGIFMYWQDRGEALSSFLYDGFHAGTGYQILSSEGRRTTSGDIDFDPLVLEPRWRNSQEQALRHFRYMFEPRKIRYLLWHGLEIGDHGWYSHPMEFMLFSPGHPAQVTLRSDFIDLGSIVGDGRPKAIRNLRWEADLPPDTRLQLRSRSGNNLEDIYTFYNKKGDVVTQDGWNKLPSVIRGPVDTTVIIGQDWGEWSNFYQSSGESFQSETPRRYLQLELIMSTEDPEVAPRVRSVAIEFEDAHVAEAKGRILPRQAEPNVDTRFLFTILPRGDQQDMGFDVLRLRVPGAVEPVGVEVRVGGDRLPPRSVAMEGDSLLVVGLPQTVKDDSVEVTFTARVLHNATVFDAELGNSDRPALWQSVEAVERRANIVFLPALADSRRIIGDLEIDSPAFTPNGDGINDWLEIRFAVFKVEDSRVRVRILDLAGRLVAELRPVDDGSIKRFTWSGQDAQGERVDPGVYLCHIDAGTESGEDEVVRAIAVAY